MILYCQMKEISISQRYLSEEIIQIMYHKISQVEKLPFRG